MVLEVPLGLALYGPVGALIAVPVTAAFQVLILQVASRAAVAARARGRAWAPAGTRVSVDPSGWGCTLTRQQTLVMRTVLRSGAHSVREHSPTDNHPDYHELIAYYEIRDRVLAVARRPRPRAGKT